MIIIISAAIATFIVQLALYPVEYAKEWKEIKYKFFTSKSKKFLRKLES